MKEKKKQVEQDTEGNKESQRRKYIKSIKEFLADKTEGVRYNDILNYLKEKYPNISIHTLSGSIRDLRKHSRVDDESKLIVPERGFYILAKYYQNFKVDTEKENEVEKNNEADKENRIKEEKFYESFANYLENNLQECTRAIPLGNNKFKDKWGTPDVLGVYKFSDYDNIIKAPIEIVSAEIKVDKNKIFEAFGQACLYKLFSHKVYLVIPKQIQDYVITRMESLCIKFGIGLILFDSNNEKEPNFEIRTRATKSEPDYYYSNLYFSYITKEQMQKLFG